MEVPWREVNEVNQQLINKSMENENEKAESSVTGYGNPSLDADPIDESTESQIDALLDDALSGVEPVFADEPESSETEEIEPIEESVQEKNWIQKLRQSSNLAIFRRLIVLTGASYKRQQAPTRNKRRKQSNYGNVLWRWNHVSRNSKHLMIMMN